MQITDREELEIIADHRWYKENFSKRRQVLLFIGLMGVLLIAIAGTSLVDPVLGIVILVIAAMVAVVLAKRRGAIIRQMADQYERE